MKPIKSKSILFLVLCCVCCVFALIAPVFASEFEPKADATDDFKSTLFISFGGQASCSVNGRSSSISHKLEVVMTLNQIGNPVPLKSWTASGTGRISMAENYYVSHGYDYQVAVTITVKNPDGRFIESFTTYSSIVHY